MFFHSDRELFNNVLFRSFSGPKAAKKNGHVNYAFDIDEGPRKRPKTVTVIDKRTGKSKPLDLKPRKSSELHTVSVQVH